jgi:hypothetical protein
MNHLLPRVFGAVAAVFFSIPAPGQESGDASETQEAGKLPAKEELVAKPKPEGGVSTAERSPEKTPPGAPGVMLTPKQQITGFYAMCKQNRGGEGLQEILSTNPVVQSSDIQRVAQSFEEMIVKMGGFLDFEILKETRLSERVVVVRCVAHFEKQPFINEFTFFDAGAGDWRLVYLKYDANLATMFIEDLMRP